MTENELLEMFIQERVNMLLVSLDKERPKKTPDYHKDILRAENIIDQLPNDERELIESYIGNINERMALEEI